MQSEPQSFSFKFYPLVEVTASATAYPNAAGVEPTMDIKVHDVWFLERLGGFPSDDPRRWRGHSVADHLPPKNADRLNRFVWTVHQLELIGMAKGLIR